MIHHNNPIARYIMKLIRKIRNKVFTLMALSIICTLSFTVPAFAETEEKKEIGPGIFNTTEEPETEEIPEGTLLGLFTTSGYCSCEKCSSGNNLTYSGTVPQARHTISADIDVLPIGSKIRIGETIYTVEDIGSSVNGNKVDIYYDSHEDAWAHGLQQQEVFLIELPEITEE